MKKAYRIGLEVLVWLVVLFGVFYYLCVVKVKPESFGPMEPWLPVLSAIIIGLYYGFTMYFVNEYRSAQFFLIGFQVLLNGAAFYWFYRNTNLGVNDVIFYWIYVIGWTLISAIPYIAPLFFRLLRDYSFKASFYLSPSAAILMSPSAAILAGGLAYGEYAFLCAYPNTTLFHWLSIGMLVLSVAAIGVLIWRLIAEDCDISGTLRPLVVPTDELKMKLAYEGAVTSRSKENVEAAKKSGNRRRTLNGNQISVYSLEDLRAAVETHSLFAIDSHLSGEDMVEWRWTYEEHVFGSVLHYTLYIWDFDWYSLEDNNQSLRLRFYDKISKKLFRLAKQNKPMNPNIFCLLTRIGFEAIVGEETDFEKAFRYLKAAAEGGEPYAQGMLGTLYASGKGVEKDDDKALYWSKLAADQGVYLANITLGNAYYNGEGVEEDPKKAAEYYRRSFEKGFSDSLPAYQYALEELYPEESEAE